MADFVNSTTVKTSVRELANPIADVATFNTIVQSVVTDNPFACVAYMNAGVNHNSVEKTKETYTARFVNEDTNAMNVGSSTEKYNTISGSAPLAAAHTGTAIHDLDKDTFTATLRCHDPNGEIYSVNFTHDRMSITSYPDDEIPAKVDTRADTVTAFA
ncbi:MAG: hypothetical protein WC295_03645 [Methanoregula sp.]